MQKKWPEPAQRHLQQLMGDRLISACTDTQRQNVNYDEKQLSEKKV
jgi:hypothetical protein